MNSAYNPDLVAHTTRRTTLAPGPHKPHIPAPHETPAAAAPAPPPHPACKNANPRVRSASRQSRAQTARHRCAVLSPCMCSLPLWRAALRSSRCPPPGSGSLHQAQSVGFSSWKQPMTPITALGTRISIVPNALGTVSTAPTHSIHWATSAFTGKVSTPVAAEFFLS